MKLQPNVADSSSETKTLPQYQDSDQEHKKAVIKDVSLSAERACDLQYKNRNEGTYFCPSLCVEAVVVAVPVCQISEYWWDWSGLIHYEDALYMTEKGNGQWSEMTGRQ